MTHFRGGEKMKKIRKVIVSAVLLVGFFFQATIAGASNMDSAIGITFDSTPRVLPDAGGGGKLPQTGEVVFGSMFLVGLVLIAFVLYHWWRRRKEEA